MSAATVGTQQAGLNCPYCRFPLKAGLPATACDGCGAIHHEECWEENGGCAIVGCTKTARHAPASIRGGVGVAAASLHGPEIEDAIRAYEAGDFATALDRLQLEIFGAEQENDEDKLEEILVVVEQMMGHLEGREEYADFQFLFASAFRQLWRVQNRTWSAGLVRARAALAEGGADDALRFCQEELRVAWEDAYARAHVIEVIRNLAEDLHDEARSRFHALASRAESAGHPIGSDEDTWWTAERLAELQADDFAPPIIDALDTFYDGAVERSFEMLQRLAFEAGARNDETILGEIEEATSQLLPDLPEGDRRAAERVIGLAARQRRLVEERVWPATLTRARRAAEDDDFAGAYSLLESELATSAHDRQAVERIASVIGEVEGSLHRGHLKASFESLRSEAESLLVT